MTTFQERLGQKIPGKNNCVICGRLHSQENTYSFPKDFPDEFKLCCFCRGDAEFLGMYGLEYVIKHVIKNPTNFPNTKLSIQYYQKVNKLITLE